MSEQERGELEPEKGPFLTPIEEKQVNFYGDSITAALVAFAPPEEAKVYVPIRPICEYLGLSWSGQRERIMRHPVMRQEMEFVRVTRTNSIEKRGNPNLLSLPLEQLPGWLFGVDSSRVKPELKEKIIRYQRECFRVLWQAFQNEAATVDAVTSSKPASTEVFTTKPEPDPFDVPFSPTPPNPMLVEVREMGRAIMQLADAQLKSEQRLDSHDLMFEQAKEAFRNIRQRMDAVEHIVRPGNPISEEQASVVAQSIKDLAQYLTQKDASASGPKISAKNRGASKPKIENYYQGIFSELYRRFGVSVYKNIPMSKYAAVLQFLADWKSAADDGVSNEVFLQGQLW